MAYKSTRSVQVNDLTNGDISTDPVHHKWTTVSVHSVHCVAAGHSMDSRSSAELRRRPFTPAVSLHWWLDLQLQRALGGHAASVLGWNPNRLTVASLQCWTSLQEFLIHKSQRAEIVTWFVEVRNSHQEFHSCQPDWCEQWWSSLLSAGAVSGWDAVSWLAVGKGTVSTWQAVGDYFS